MKADIHPKYFENVEIRCSCGNVVVSGSTRDKLKTELCSKCHPFYTGTQKLVDTAGRVDKFQEKRKRAAAINEELKKQAQAAKKKPEVYVEKEVPAEVLERAMAASAPKGKWGGPLGDSPAQEVAKDAAKVPAKKAPAKVASKKPVAKKPSSKTPKKKSAPAKKPSSKKK